MLFFAFVSLIIPLGFTFSVGGIRCITAREE